MARSKVCIYQPNIRLQVHEWLQLKFQQKIQNYRPNNKNFGAQLSQVLHRMNFCLHATTRSRRFQKPINSFTTDGSFKIRFCPLYPGLLKSWARLFYRLKVQGGGSLGLMISGTIKLSPMKLCTVILLLSVKKTKKLKAYQPTRIQKEIFKTMIYDVTMTSLLKTMGTFGPPRNQTNYTSFEK